MKSQRWKNNRLLEYYIHDDLFDHTAARHMKMSRAEIIYMPKTASPKNKRIFRKRCTIRKEFRLRGCREFFGIKLAGKSGAN
jgi:hypothetical protein